MFIQFLKIKEIEDKEKFFNKEKMYEYQRKENY